MDPYDFGDLEDDFEEPVCPACSGPAFQLGALGNRIHYRCRNCGADHSRLTTEASHA